MSPRPSRRRPAGMDWWQRFIPQRLRDITQLHVTVTALVAFFMLLFYVLTLFQPLGSPVLFAFRVSFCLGSLAMLATVIAMGDRLPAWVMYAGAVAEIGAFVYFVGFTSNHQQVVFRLQEFPLIALYLAWLFPPWLTRLTIYPVMAFTIPYAVFVGPAAGTEHGQGLLNVVSLMFFTILGMGVGGFVRERFKQQTEFDELTGALNRRGLSAYGEPALLRGRRLARPLTVAVVDLDDFKTINDTQGHAAGDQVLQDLVKHLQQSTRKSDLVCRLGGDEFVLVFPDTYLREVEALMRRTRLSSSCAWTYGVAEATEEDNLSTVILRADRAMYLAKRAS